MEDLFTGLFLIVIGFLVVKFPMLIAGYNTMSKKEREKVDIKGLSRMMRRWLVVIGCLTIFVSALLSKLGYAEMKPAIITIIILAGTLGMLVNAQKYET